MGPMRLSARVAVAATAFLCALGAITPAQAEVIPVAAAVTTTAMVAVTARPIPVIGPIAPKVQAADFATPASKPLLITTAAGNAAAGAIAKNGSLSDLVSNKLASDTADDEHECLATSVYFESKGQPYKGQLAVAETILNRTKSGRFPSTVCGVVKQRGQFGFVRGGRFPGIKRAAKQWQEAVAIAQIALKSAFAEVANKALYFNAGRRPSPGLQQVARFGAQVFYR